MFNSVHSCPFMFIRVHLCPSATTRDFIFLPGSRVAGGWWNALSLLQTRHSGRGNVAELTMVPGVAPSAGRPVGVEESGHDWKMEALTFQPLTLNTSRILLNLIYKKIVAQPSAMGLRRAVRPQPPLPGCL